MKVVSTAKLNTPIKERLITVFPEVTFFFYENIKEAATELPDTEILLTYGDDLTTKIITKMPKLKWVMVISAGVERLPFTAIKDQGITVTNARGIHKIPMAEYTIAMMLQVTKQTRKLWDSQQQKRWDHSIELVELYGKTIGILGAGAIGAEIANYAKVFQMKTIGLNSDGTPVPGFDEMITMDKIKKLISQSDFIVSVLPSTPNTKGILNKGLFNQMQSHAVFINIGRGETVVEKDLLVALDEGLIAHAVLDVFEKEPLPSDHPFWGMENVTVTPHISGISAQYQMRAMDIFENNLRSFLVGDTELCNVIDLSKGY